MQLLHEAQKADGKRAKKKKKEEQMKVEKENKLARVKVDMSQALCYFSRRPFSPGVCAVLFIHSRYCKFFLIFHTIII